MLCVLVEEANNRTPTTHASSIALNLVCELQAFIFKFKLDFPAGTLPIFPYRSKGPSSTINSDWVCPRCKSEQWPIKLHAFNSTPPSITAKTHSHAFSSRLSRQSLYSHGLLNRKQTMSKM